MVCFYIAWIDSGRVYPGFAKGSIIPRVFTTDGTNEPFLGKCVYFTRVNASVEITPKNVADASSFLVCLSVHPHLPCSKTHHTYSYNNIVHVTFFVSWTIRIDKISACQFRKHGCNGSVECFALPTAALFTHFQTSFKSNYKYRWNGQKSRGTINLQPVLWHHWPVHRISSE